MPNNSVAKVARIIGDAGGSVVGRTRLQKIAYLLTVTGLEEGFDFSYKHYGPFSEDVASAALLGHMLGQLREVEQQASWGGTYSIYTVELGASSGDSSPRRQLSAIAAAADAVELELSATAVFLAREGYDDPWAETARRKPEKAEGRIEQAKSLLQKLRAIPTPRPLPANV